MKNLCEISVPGLSWGTRRLPNTYLPSTYLNLAASNITEIPPGIKQLSWLKHLLINNCKKLKPLPEFLFSSQLLEASRSGSHVPTTPYRAFRPGLWDNHHNCDYSIFCGCLKLDDKIITYFLLRVLCIVLIVEEGHYPISWEYRVTTCCPGDDIPKWFNYSSEGSSVRVLLPPQWPDFNLGFAVCIVTDSCFESEDLFLRCDLYLRSSSDKYLAYDCHEGSLQTIPSFDSDHILMMYWPIWRRNPKVAEARFYFASPNGKKCTTVSAKIKRCGIRILYRQDIDELFNLINNPYLLEQSAAFPDRPEPSAPSIIDSDNEELPSQEN